MPTADWVLSSETAEELRDCAQQVIRMGVDFKQRSPLTTLPGVDRESMVAPAVTDLGVPLARLVEWLGSVIFPGSLNLGSPTFLAHPDNGSSTAALLGDIASAF